MAYNLVIVESPAKARTINNFLDNTEVIASRGHIRDLPSYTLGVKFEGDTVTCVYEIDKDHRDVVKKMKSLAERAGRIYIATDEDREGEAIGFHIATVLNLDVKTVDRIAFHEITKTAIKHAIENPRKLNLSMVNSQVARRALDRVVGFNLSTFLNKKIGKGLSAGRVQSSTLSLVVDREKEIMEFKSVKYFIVNGEFESMLNGVLTQIKDKRLEATELRDEEEVKKLVHELNGKKFKILKVEKTRRKVKPNPPFTTSTLQQTASNKLGYTPETTMSIAQKLYEGVNTPNGVTGVITYMRTDSLNIAKEAQVACREMIKTHYGDKYLSPNVRNFVTNSKGAQEAHEAIRPTHIEFTPEIASKYLEPEQLKLYGLIYNRFIATQSTEAEFENTKCKIADLDEEYIFEANGSIMVFDGFQKFIGVDHKAKVLPDLKEGYEFSHCKITGESKETQPPGRYTEASLVSTMEKLGIGRPSTYAATTSLLLKRKYVVKEGKALKATENAFLIVNTLREYFSKIVDIKFTASMEESLDDVSTGKVDWQSYLCGFYREFESDLSNANTNMKSLKAEPVPTGEICPQCGGNLMKITSKYGEFIGCSNYPKCKHTVKLNNPTMEALEVADFKCPLCNGDVVIRQGKWGKYFACEKYVSKECTFANKYKPVEGNCPQCGGYMVMKFGKKSCHVNHDGKSNFKRKWKKKK